MKVKNVMHHGVEWAEAGTSVAELAMRMRDQDIGCIPIGENDRLIGMVTDRDIALKAVADGRDIASLTAKDVMTKGIVCCRETDEVANAVHIMESRQIRRLPVLNDSKRMTGMLSLGDVAQATQKVTAHAMKAISGHHA
jgi:CBS domain-containing protein